MNEEEYSLDELKDQMHERATKEAMLIILAYLVADHAIYASEEFECDEDYLINFMLKEVKKALALSNPDLNDAKEFRSLLNTGFSLLTLSERTFARELGVDQATVNRWKNGKHAPHPLMRPVVYRRLKKRAMIRDAVTKVVKERKDVESNK